MPDIESENVLSQIKASDLEKIKKHLCETDKLSLVSHPAKFSHPNAKSKLIDFKANYVADGFLHSGNVSNIKSDISGTATAMPVAKFFLLLLSDGKAMFEHLELQSEKVQNDLKMFPISFEELRDGFLAMKKNKALELTDSKIKQVYFPIDGGYHLLSILLPSGIIYNLKSKVNKILDRAKKARKDKKENFHNEEGFEDLYNLTIIGYGGTKSQNISALNSTNGGKAYLLPSLPPSIDKRYLHLPHKDFFTECLWLKDFSDEFNALHKIFFTEYNNKNIRDGRDYWLQSIVDKVIDKMWSLRSAKPEWTKNDNCNLPKYQKIWLDSARQEEREMDSVWLDEVTSHFASWIISAYEKVIGKKAKQLDDKFWSYVKKRIEQNLQIWREEDLG